MGFLPLPERLFQPICLLPLANANSRYGVLLPGAEVPMAWRASQCCPRLGFESLDPEAGLLTPLPSFHKPFRGELSKNAGVWETNRLTYTPNAPAMARMKAVVSWR